MDEKDKFRSKQKPADTKEALAHKVELARQYLDVDGNITMINRKGNEILGYSQKELLSKNWFDLFVPPEIKKELVELQKNIMQSNEEIDIYHENEAIVRSDARWLIAWHNMPLFDENGHTIGVLCSGNDITELCRARYRIKENERFQNAVIEHLPLLLNVLW